MAQWMFEFMIAVRQNHHLDAVGVQALVVDQPSRKHPRLRRVVRLDVDPTLEALEAMAVGIAEILVEGDAISVHLAPPILPAWCRSLLSVLHAGQPLAIAQHDLTVGADPDSL